MDHFGPHLYRVSLFSSAGYIHSRVEEEFLWDCKQLGAYSPIVLLNTLLFFCCKYFGFTSVEQHRQLSFAHVMRCTKTNQNNTKTTFLRFYPPISINEAESGTIMAGGQNEIISFILRLSTFKIESISTVLLHWNHHYFNHFYFIQSLEFGHL